MARFDNTGGGGGFGRFGGRIAIVIMAFGLLAVGLGWNGAAGNHLTPAQIPYMVSGLGVGLSLVIIGSAMMTLQGYREERQRLENKLDQVIAALGGGGSVASSFGLGASSAAPADLAGLVIAGSASFHRPGCRLVDGREEVEYLTPDEAGARFLQPCRVCKPATSGAATR